MKKNIAVFLDRDGTIIHDKNYLSDPSKVVLYKGTPEAIRKLQKAGFKIVVVTNQSGIGRGYFTESDYKKVNAKMISLLKTAGVKLDAVYYCPHITADECSCRKPDTKMALDAEKKLNLDLKKSYVIGDNTRDIEFGNRVGAKGILVLTGHGKRYARKINKNNKPIAVTKNIISASNIILHDKKNA